MVDERRLLTGDIAIGHPRQPQRGSPARRRAARSAERHLCRWSAPPALTNTEDDLIGADRARRELAAIEDEVRQATPARSGP